MTTDREWESLAATWSAASPDVPAAPLRALVKQQRGRMFVSLACDIFGVLAFVALSYEVVRDGIEPWEKLWLITLWPFLFLAAGIAIWSRRGLWAPLGDSTAEYVRITKERCLRQRKMVRLVVAMAVLEIATVVAQLAWWGRLRMVAFVLLGIVVGAIAVWCWIVEQRAKRELRQVEEWM